ncbi:hypothetical protein [Pseudomonas sp. Teo4]|uniref:hypothetical protein n=1 Tax=Pseudomonas sp. Teo4 TaxID=3064528 RepID=UPI002ACB05F2|nr:hypothetical protein [Pseudomonas sp. Teo4]
MDESKIPPEGDTVQGREIAKSVVTQAGSAQTAHSVIRILFVTTKQSRANYSYPELIVSLGLQSVNEVMKNSRINITVESAGIYHANYDESGKNYSQLLEDLAKNMKDVAQAREGLLADLVSMIVINKEWRGLAYLAPPRD